MEEALAKSITYRIIIIILDFVIILIFNNKVEVALGFTILSNLYSSIVYYIHEKIWNKTYCRNKISFRKFTL